MRFPWASFLLVWIAAQACVLAAESKPFRVKHTPERPRSGEAVRITIAANPPASVRAPVLQYQLVDPGRYIEAKDPAYKNNWVSVPMHDDGREGDTLADDGVFTAELPGSLQQHRRLGECRTSGHEHDRVARAHIDGELRDAHHLGALLVEHAQVDPSHSARGQDEAAHEVVVADGGRARDGV